MGLNGAELHPLTTELQFLPHWKKLMQSRFSLTLVYVAITKQQCMYACLHVERVCAQLRTGISGVLCYYCLLRRTGVNMFPQIHLKGPFNPIINELIKKIRLRLSLKCHQCNGGEWNLVCGTVLKRTFNISFQKQCHFFYYGDHRTLSTEEIVPTPPI